MIQDSLQSFHEGQPSLSSYSILGKEPKIEDIIKIALNLYELGSEDLSLVAKISEAR